MTDCLRYTVDGSDALEAKLEGICRTALDGVRALIPARTLLGLVLAGDHAVGEGGVLRSDGDERFFGDLRFHVLLRGNARSAEKNFRRGLDELAEKLALKADVERVGERLDGRLVIQILQRMHDGEL